MVGVNPRLGVAAQIEAQLRARSRRRVVNLCPIAAMDARALAAMAEKHGHGYMDAPLTGTPAEARRGALMVLVSGDAAYYEALLPLFKCLGERVFHIDTRSGKAQLMYHINGALSATLFAVPCEAFVAGAKAKLTPQVMTRVMDIETGRNAASAYVLPEQIATRGFRHGKCIGEALQELDAVSAEAPRLGVTNSNFEKTRLICRLAAHPGSADDDTTRPVTHYEAWAKAEVRSRDKLRKA